MEHWIKDVDYYLMPSNYPVKGFEKQYLATYECWRNSWEKFRAEIGIKKPLVCDGFSITHETGAVFYKGECVGMTAFTYGSLDQGPLQHHSWWDGWSPEALCQLKSISSNVMIGSQFSVNPKFTGKGHIVRWKEIVSLYNLLRVEASIADLQAGNLNCTRGVQNVCGEDSGATLLGNPFQYNFYGVDVLAQLMAYEKKNIAAMKERKNITGLCDDLWSRLTHISSFPVLSSKVVPLNKAA